MRQEAPLWVLDPWCSPVFGNLTSTADSCLLTPYYYYLVPDPRLFRIDYGLGWRKPPLTRYFVPTALKATGTCQAPEPAETQYRTGGQPAPTRHAEIPNTPLSYAHILLAVRLLSYVPWYRLGVTESLSPIRLFTRL